MNNSNRHGYAGAADADPLQGMDALVLCTACHHHTLPMFHYGYWQCSDLEAFRTSFLKPSTPRLKLLKLRIWISLSLIATETVSLDVGMVEGSNFRLACFLRLNPPSLRCSEATGSQERVIQPEKEFYGLGCYVGSGTGLSGVLRQILAARWLIDLGRLE